MNKEVIKRKIKKVGTVFGLSVLMSGVTAGTVLAAGWAQNDVGWWYDIGNGTYPAGSWYQVDGDWYSFDDNGYMRTGFIYESSGTYYCKESGRMITGWYKIGKDWYYFNGSGVMAKNKWIDDCYLLSSGKMATNREIDGYWVGSDGKWDPEYFEEETTEEFEEEKENSKENETEPIKDTTPTKESMKELETERETKENLETEKYETEEETEENTEIEDGWNFVGGHWYFYQDGEFVRNQLCESSGKLFYVGSNGQLQKNKTVTVDGKEYVLGADGTAVEKREESALSISGHTRIVNYIKGEKFPLDGVISSNYVISKINIKIYMNYIIVYDKTFNPNVKKYNLSEHQINAVDMKSFSDVRKSRVVVTAADDSNEEKIVIDDTFTSSYPESVRVTISGETIPSSVVCGHNFGLYGTIESNYPIDVVEGKISKKQDGTEIVMRKEEYPNSKSYDLHGPINDALIFERLEKGYYYYTVTVWTNGAEKKVINRRFMVK